MTNTPPSTLADVTPAGDANDPVVTTTTTTTTTSGGDTPPDYVPDPTPPPEAYETQARPLPHVALLSIIKERKAFHDSAAAYATNGKDELQHRVVAFFLTEILIIDERMEHERKKVQGA